VYATGRRPGGAMEGAKPAVAMVALQLLFSALQIFIQLALDDGMDARVLVAYRFMFDAAVLCPIAFFVERYIPSGLWTRPSWISCFFLSLFVGESRCNVVVTTRGSKGLLWSQTLFFGFSVISRLK
jgi:hypothetical protein